MQSYLCWSEINTNMLCKIWYTENGVHSFTVLCIIYHYCACTYTFYFAIFWIEHNIGKVFWQVGGNGCLLFRIKVHSATPNRHFRKNIPLWKCEVWYGKCLFNTHMFQILNVYITKYTHNEYIQTVNGERWKNAAFFCAVNMLTLLLLATWLENLRNFNRANKTAVRTKLSLRCSYFLGVVLCHCTIGTERFETAYCFCRQGLTGYWILEDEITILPWNIRHPSLSATEPYPRRTNTWTAPHWKPKNLQV